MNALKAALCLLLLGTILCFSACIAPDSPDLGSNTSESSESSTVPAPETTVETADIWEDTSDTAATGDVTGFPNEPDDGHTKRY